MGKGLLPCESSQQEERAEAAVIQACALTLVSQTQLTQVIFLS